MKKWEISLWIAVVVTVFCCAAAPNLTAQWWTAAFSPLCDGILTAGADGEIMILRSKLWELLSQYVF